MRLPDPSRRDAPLRRLFDTAELYNTIVYHELAVLADSHTLQAKGYHTVVVCTDQVWVLTLKEKKRPPQGLKWRDLETIEQLQDIATFMAPEIANDTCHVRMRISDQIGSARPTLDIFTFYEDSKLFHYLYHTWMNAQMRLSLTSFYPLATSQKDKGIQHLSSPPVAVLFETLTSEWFNIAAASTLPSTTASTTTSLLPLPSMASLQPLQIPDTNVTQPSPSPPAPADVISFPNPGQLSAKIRVLEEITIAVCGNRAFQKLCLESPTLFPFVLSEIRSLRDIKQYAMSNAREYVRAHPTFASSYHHDRVQYLCSLLCFISKLMAGSEVGPQRQALVQHGLRDLVYTILLDDSSRVAYNYIQQVITTYYSQAMERQQFQIRQQEEETRRKQAATLYPQQINMTTNTLVPPNLGPVHPETDVQLDHSLTRIRDRLYEVEHMQVECLYHIMTLLEWNTLTSQQPTSNMDTLVQTLTSLDSFVNDICPQYVHNLIQLLTQAHTLTVGYYVHCYATLLCRVLQRSSVLRECVVRENLSEFRHQLGVPAAAISGASSPSKRPASALIKLQSSSFFYRRTERLITSIIQQLQDTHY